jgi:hypothetical protein
MAHDVWEADADAMVISEVVGGVAFAMRTPLSCSA